MSANEISPLHFACHPPESLTVQTEEKQGYNIGSIPNIETFPTTSSLRQPWRDFVPEPSHRKWINSAGVFRLIAELDFEK